MAYYSPEGNPWRQQDKQVGQRASSCVCDGLRQTHTVCIWLRQSHAVSDVFQGYGLPSGIP